MAKIEQSQDVVCKESQHNVKKESLIIKEYIQLIEH